MEKTTSHQTDAKLRDWLKQSLEVRLARNPNYSVRAFARDLEIDASQLSAILKGKKGLSPEKAQKIARVLGLSAAETKLFLLTVKQERSRSAKAREQAKNEISSISQDEKNPFQVLTMDVYRMVSDWHNTAILEYLRRPRANQTSEVIARNFQISPLQVEESLNRLERLGWIEKRGDRWKVTQGAILAPSGVPSEALRNHHTQVLRKAETALHFQSLEERNFMATELVIRKDRIPEMKEYLHQMWLTFCDQFVENETGDSVYEFSYQLFELGKIQLTKKTPTQRSKS